MTGTNTLFGTELRVGDVIALSSNTFVVTAISSNTAGTVDTNPATGAISATSCVRYKRSPFAEPSRNMVGTVAVTANVATVTATIASGEQGSGSFTRQYTAGDIIKINGEERKIKAVTNTSSMTTTVAFTNAASAQTHSRTWEYAGSFDKEPVSTAHSAAKGALHDEVHVIVVDEDGEWTGTRETALESYTGVSVALGAKFEDGTSAYYVDAINRKSKYVWWMDHDALGDAYTTAGADVTAWGTAAASGTEYMSSAATGNLLKTLSLSGGVDGSAPSDSDKITSFNKFKDAEEVDIGLIVGGEASATVALQLIAIAEGRKDVVAFLSPEQSDVVNSEGTEVTNVVDFRNTLGSSSYAVLDSGWKYMYDKYNDVYRYIPLNGDVAGCCAFTDATRDPFWSTAGIDRGNIRNAIKLPFNPNKTQRDALYKVGVNPVTAMPGSGILLFGDKTLLAKPSAFDRINVRRLFILLEKSIANMAKSFLFEFNDAFTRSRFSGTVTAFMDDIKGRNGVQDFAVVCDESNNTSEVVDRNEFRGDIYIKPSRSINFIQLQFVAVRSGVEFSEVIG